MKSSWCDKLASVPAIGIWYPKRFVTADATLERLGPLLSSWVDGDKDLFTVKTPQPFRVDISTEDGFDYAIENEKLVVMFKHRMKMRPVSGGYPTVEMMSEPLPYTELLSRVSWRLKEVMRLLDPKSEVVIQRIGIVSATEVAATDAPPGLGRLLEYVGRPWGGMVVPYDLTLTAPITKNDRYSDRCIHGLSKREEADSLMTTRFDWQRYFSESRSVRGLDDLLDQAIESALAYFEDVAEGSRFNDDRSFKG